MKLLKIYFLLFTFHGTNITAAAPTSSDLRLEVWCMDITHVGIDINWEVVKYILRSHCRLRIRICVFTRSPCVLHAHNILKNTASVYEFSHFSVYKNHLKTLLWYRCSGPTPRVSESISQMFGYHCDSIARTSNGLWTILWS